MRRADIKVLRHLADGAISIEVVVDVSTLNDRDIRNAEPAQENRQRLQESRIGDGRAVLAMVTHHERRLDGGLQPLQRFSKKPGPPLDRVSQPAKVADRAVSQMPLYIARNLSKQRSGRGDGRRQRARKRRLDPAGMLQDGGGPPRHAARRLPEKRLDAEAGIADLEDGAANVNGMHLFIFPDPHHGMADEVADLIIDGHVEEAGVDERLAVSHRHEFFALQSQKKETEHFLPRPAGKFAVQLFELKPELLNDAAGMDRIFHFNLFTELIARLQPQNQDSGSRKVPAPPVGGWRPAVLEVEE